MIAAHATLNDGDGPLGPRLKRRRQELGLTLDQVATHLGTNRQQVIRWEKNQNRPTDYAEPLATLYGWPVEALLPVEPEESLVERVRRLEELVADLVRGQRTRRRRGGG